MTGPLILHPRPPYDFHLSALIFAGGDPAFRTYTNGVLSMALDTGEMPVLIRIRSTGTVARPCLLVTVSGAGPVPPWVRPLISEQVDLMLNLSEDLFPFYEAVSTDSQTADLIHELYGLRIPTTSTLFEALTDSIIEQQISLAVAYKLEHRLIQATGRAFTHEGTRYFCYPRPEVLAETRPEVFRACGLTLRKGSYIREISARIRDHSLDLEALSDRHDTEEIITALCTIRGVGRWTAELTALRGFHRPDAFPAADIALRRMISERFLDGRRISAEEAMACARPWGAWKGFIGFYLEVGDRLKHETWMHRPPLHPGC